MSFTARFTFTSPNAAFVTAAAHGITPRTIATWNAELPRTPRVLVPIQLDVLMVRSEGGTWADCKMKELDGTQVGVTRRDQLPPPFKDLDKPRPKGAYLHWALPDALTHGTVDGNNATLPAIPDRWLVLRLSPSATLTDRRAVRGWVLQIGDPNEKDPVVTDLDQWTEPGALPADAPHPLTAAGFGDLAWAAYYDNVVNRLGFYDALGEVSSGPVAYLVCGWYSNPAFDPLGDTKVKSLTDFDARMAELRWHLVQGELDEAVNHSFQYWRAAAAIGLSTQEFGLVNPGATSNLAGSASLTPDPGSQPALLDASGHPIGGVYTTDGSWWPKLTVYHGSVIAIGWPGIGWAGNPNGLIPPDPNQSGVEAGEFGGPPPASSVNLAVASTLTEALAAVVAHANQSPSEARVLEAFTVGALTELDQPDGPARLDALLQANTFGSMPGGEITEQIWIPPTPDTPPTLPSNPAPKDDGIFKNFRPPVHRNVIDVVPFGDVVARESGAVEAHPFVSALELRESNLASGGLRQAFAGLGPTVAAPQQIPGHYVEAKRSLPRLFYPTDPVLLVQGAKRSFKYGGDGVYSQDGTLACRLTGFCVTELSCSAVTGMPNRPSIRGDDVLERGVENGSVPPECEDLLRELVLLDPGTAIPASQSVINSGQLAVATAGVTAAPTLSTVDLQGLARNLMVEQTAWHAVRDPRVDQGPLLAQSGIAGVLPSPIAVNLPVRPWNPIHLDWQIQFIPSPRGVTDWTLDEIDFDATGKDLPDPGDTKSGIIRNGRAHLAGGAAATFAAAVHTALDQASRAGGTAPLPARFAERFPSDFAQTFMVKYFNATQALATNLAAAGGGEDGVPGVDRSALGDIASALDQMDVLVGSLDSFHVQLRGGYPGDGKSAPGQGKPAPSPFVALRAGFMRILRLRLVDGYGQVLDLVGSSATSTVDPKLLLESEALQVSGRPDIQALPPRFTSPARLWFRYMDASGDIVDATPDKSPVCGYLMPDHLDGALEFFDADGNNLGVVRPDPQAGVLWEEAPGQPSTVGQSPSRAIPNQFLAGIAQGLLDWGIADATLADGHEDALSAFLRIIDSTLWAVDPYAHAGDEHLALLEGHPVAVMRARLKVEVQEPINPEALNVIALPVRLGALVHWQDGLFGYFVNDDYRTLYCADEAVASFAREVGPLRGFLQPINLVPDFYQQFADDLGAGVTEGKSPVKHPYVDSGLLWIRPNQEVRLTLLVEPHSVIHATTGFLPRKEIGVRREWVASALAKLAPTFRFGPVLVDPKRIRMPVANELQGTWSWDHRSDISNWAEDPVTNATTDALLPADPASGTEGWLKLTPGTNT